MILCFPDEFGDENLVCRIISGDCTITTPPPANGQPLPTSIGIELLLCIEVQVLAAVKLEVLAKFCSPRPPIPISGPNVCPPLFFPEQCDFFPQPNCDCQSTVDNECLVETGPGAACTLIVNGEVVTEGSQRLRATICDGCAGINTRIEYRYRGRTRDEDFTFRADSFITEECDNGSLPITHTISGIGQVYGAVAGTSGSITVNYELELIENTSDLPDQYELRLSGNGFDARAINEAVPGLELRIRNCTQFPEPL